MNRDSIAVVIPALNESLRIREVVQGALAECRNVIVVDDGSDDDTVEKIRDLPITLLRHRERLGKGASLRDGFAEALRQGVAGVLTMDGDGQHSAADIPRMLDAARRYPRHIVIGARLRKRSQQPRYRRLANAFGDWGIAWGTGYQIADTQSGQRLYPAEVVALGDLPGEDFVFESQILISAARELGMRCVSVPIESRYACVHATEAAADQEPQFRASHFRPLRDFTRITTHVVATVLRQGGIWDAWRSARANPPLIDDPSGEFAVAATPREATSR